MTDQPASIDEVFPDRKDMRTYAILRCTACGETGDFYSTGEIHDEHLYFSCSETGDLEKHEVVLSSIDGVKPDE